MAKRRASAARSPWGAREDREREREAKREAVLTTAVRFFNMKGFHATSLDDVALALNVTKPTIYHYFASKDDILFACVQLGLNRIRDAVETAAAQGGSGLDRLRALMREYALVMTRDFGVCVMRTSDDQLSQESRAKFRAGKREIDKVLRGVIADGVADGSIAPGDVRAIAFTLAGALNSIARWYDPKGPATAQDVADQTVAILVDGLKPSRGR
ncbi:TetR/AcrR family transcriptional regulator [Terrarubrum flagellatum]|uniref:TetR/AcrR family transcriptional regulator n=1 Tax=Terrirubrum flagellatum TaxID=2895980 RepID=UPI003144EA01